MLQLVDGDIIRHMYMSVNNVALYNKQYMSVNNVTLYNKQYMSVNNVTMYNKHETLTQQGIRVASM